jgi:enoyl-CoA hydratase
MAKRAVNNTLDTMGFSNAIASLAATAGKTVVMADLDRMKAAGRAK